MFQVEMCVPGFPRSNDTTCWQMQQESKSSKGQMSVRRGSVWWMSIDYLAINMASHTVIGYCLCKYQQSGTSPREPSSFFQKILFRTTNLRKQFIANLISYPLTDQCIDIQKSQPVLWIFLSFIDLKPPFKNQKIFLPNKLKYIKIPNSSRPSASIVTVEAIPKVSEESASFSYANSIKPCLRSICPRPSNTNKCPWRKRQQWNCSWNFQPMQETGIIHVNVYTVRWFIFIKRIFRTMPIVIKALNLLYV